MFVRSMGIRMIKIIHKITEIAGYPISNSTSLGPVGSSLKISLKSNSPVVIVIVFSSD